MNPGSTMSEPPRVIYVLTSGLDIGSTIAASLASRGARVAWLTDGADAPAADLGEGVTRIAASFVSRVDLETAFASAVEQVGAPNQVVASAIPHIALVAQDIATISDEHWRAACAAAMKSVLHGLQAGHRHLSARGGSVVVIGPSLSLAGAPQLVALCTAVEGQRGLVKSTARQWGKSGVTVNWIAAAPRGLSSLFDKLPLPVKPDPVPVAFGRPLDLASEIAPVIEFLGSGAGRAMTGGTLVLDGGEWMVP
jgi:NAD(P)-dependent dehydrogenase (short-subunit alcohol dehydrogenase family)